MSSIKKERGKNIVFRIISIFVLWRYLNTYFEIKNNYLFVSQYQSNHLNNNFTLNDYEVELTKIKKIGFPTDFELDNYEVEKQGIYGNYKSQEITIILDDNSFIPLNARPYTKKQIRNLISNLIHSEVTSSQPLKRILSIK